jgi:hypothetical protein
VNKQVNASCILVFCNVAVARWLLLLTSHW